MTLLRQIKKELKEGQTICLSFGFFYKNFELKWYQYGFEKMMYYHYGNLQNNTLHDIKLQLRIEFKGNLIFENLSKKEIQVMIQEGDNQFNLKMRHKTKAELREEAIDSLIL